MNGDVKSRWAATSGLLWWVASYLVVALGLAIVATPVVAERAVEGTAFEDAIGTLPVELSLCREGRSTLETGVLGDVHWEHPAPADLGVRARVLGPPLAGGTLSSYVDRRFIQANLDFIKHPDEAVTRWIGEFGDRIQRRVWVTSTVIGLVGALPVVVPARRRGPPLLRGATRGRLLLLAGVLVVGLLASSLTAWVLLTRWECNGRPTDAYAFAPVPQLSFSSPQTRELALQIQPFLEKNTERVQIRSRQYAATAEESFARELARHGDRLAPRIGEVLVSAEADPQGAFVGTSVRAQLYELLVESLGTRGPVLRTISGDITSNGTVAEDAFVMAEAEAGGEIPVAAIAGDHDSTATHAQMEDHGMVVPDLRTEEVGGLRVSGANDVEHKALFGQLISNESGLTEQELGARLREAVSPDEAGIVLLHQPDAAAGYLGVDGPPVAQAPARSLTEPYDDGVPDVPPGTVNIGHLHDLAGPWVLWNTDGDTVTWTVVDQLGTTGGVEENATFNRFSTPFSVPLKPLAWRLQYVHAETGLQTGYASVSCDVQGNCSISRRTDVGLPLAADGAPLKQR